MREQTDTDTAQTPRDQITRGADLTDADLRVLVDDFYIVRNWAALQMHMGVPEQKEHLFQAIRARLGRIPLIIPEVSA